MKRALAVLTFTTLAASLSFALDSNAAKEAAATIDAKRIGATIDALCAPEMQGRRAGTTGGKKTTAFLAKAFEDAGLQKLEGESSYLFALPDGDENVAGRVPGTDLAAEAIVISAHWDGAGEDEAGKLVPGADENGSGLAALLETARALSKTKPRRTLVFAAFGGWWDPKDDTRRFRGAKVFAKKPGKAKPVFQIGLYMLGAALLPSEPERFFALGAESSAEVIEVVKAATPGCTDLKMARPSIDIVEKRGPRDDYDAFRAVSVPFVLLMSGVSKHYHKATDVPAHVDTKRIAAAARFAIDVVARVDAADAAPTFAKEPLVDDKLDAAEVLGLIEAALDPKSGITMKPAETKALTLKRDRIRGLIEEAGEGTKLDARERAVLKDALELLLLCLQR